MKLGGDYQIMRYICRGCKERGLIDCALVGGTRLGLTGLCHVCGRRETCWFDLMEGAGFSDNDEPTPGEYTTAIS
jgi:hypothetical protein